MLSGVREEQRRQHQNNADPQGTGDGELQAFNGKPVHIHDVMENILNQVTECGQRT